MNPSDSGKFIGMERGKAVAKGRSLAGSAKAVVEVTSPDMASEACREPVGGLGEKRRDYKV